MPDAPPPSTRAVTLPWADLRWLLEELSAWKSWGDAVSTMLGRKPEESR